MGSRRIHRHAHRNPAVQFRPTSVTHDVRRLAAIDRFVAINSAIEVDLTGQVNSETVSGRYVGAVGGAHDFLRGAQLSRGGLPIVALPSRAGSVPRIVPRIRAPVTVSRSDAAIMVTEHGVADLRGTTLKQRVQRMLAIAHPDDRNALESAYALSAGARQ
jgi:acyl-CoA hydrolase